MTDAPGVEPGADQPVPDAGEPHGRIAAARAKAEQLQHLAEERLERERAQRGWVRKLFDAYEADRNRGGGLLAGGLAYRLFLWGLPATLFVVTIFGAAAAGSDETPEAAAHHLGLGSAVATMVSNAAAESQKSPWFLALIGFVLMVWAGRSAARAFRLVAEIAWRRRESFRPSSVKSSLAFSAIALGSVAMQAVSVTLFAERAAIRLGEWALVTVLFVVLAVWIMTVLPHGGRSWLAVVPGAITFVAALRGLSLATAIYFVPKLGRIEDLYGALGFAIVILLWLYVIARVYVGAQFLNATFAGVSEAQIAGGPLDANLKDAGTDEPGSD